MNSRALFFLGLPVLLAGCDLVSDRFSPYSPHTVSATGGIGEASIQWDASSTEDDSASIHYTVRAVQDPSKRCSTVGAVSCVITGLTNESVYTFVVTATGPGGTSPRSKPSAPITPSAVPGVNWRKQVSGTVDRLNGIVWTGTKFVAVGRGYYANQLHATILTSTDGVTWADPYWINGAELYSVVWTGPVTGPGTGLLVAVGENGAGNLIMTSPDGVTWTQQTVPTSTATLRKVAWGNNRLVAVGDEGRLLTSPNGITWASQNSGASDANLTSLVWTGARWIVTGWTTSPFYQGVVLASTDDTSWTRSLASGVLGPVVWTGDRLLAGGLYDSTWASTEGIFWTGTGSNVTGIVDAMWRDPSTGAGVGQFMALATGGETFAHSADGVTWSIHPLDPRGHGYGTFYGLAGTAEKLVIVGLNGDIRLSP